MPPLHSEVHALEKHVGSRYHMRSIMTRSSFETAFDYIPRILGPKIAEFPCLVHNGVKNIQAEACNDKSIGSNKHCMGRNSMDRLYAKGNYVHNAY